ncbi:hypothetical protein ATANTOWER_024694 [Ataeniobius toweri]|uniref:Uncharacterized protein n=1 Tax=Ataeniobius toweri TaxID=208326 RepID=A0ABU7BV12_9TELE|nr:hypothetical protein [Ataeniobius toweri]
MQHSHNAPDCHMMSHVGPSHGWRTSSGLHKGNGKTLNPRMHSINLLLGQPQEGGVTAADIVTGGCSPDRSVTSVSSGAARGNMQVNIGTS